jgi:hypothetical protein
VCENTVGAVERAALCIFIGQAQHQDIAVACDCAVAGQSPATSGLEFGGGRAAVA